MKKKLTSQEITNAEGGLALFFVAQRLVETANVCRGCEWDVSKSELIQLLTSLEREAQEAIAISKGERK